MQAGPAGSSAGWRPRLQCLQEAVWTQVEEATTPEQLNKVLLEACCQLFPAKRRPRQAPQCPECPSALRQMWQARRSSKHHANAVVTLIQQRVRSGAATPVPHTGAEDGRLRRHIFGMWAQRAQSMRHHKSFRKEGRARRRAEVLETLARAETAAAQHNHRRSYTT